MDNISVNTLVTSVHLPITLGNELLIEVDGYKARLRSELVGMDRSAYLIIKLSLKELPAADAAEVKGKDVIIRYLYKGSVYGLKTKAICAVAEPAELLFVTYPKRIEEFNVRNNPRYECILPASSAIGQEQVEMVIVDISRQGCRIVIRTGNVLDRDSLFKALDIDKSLGIDVNLPGRAEKLTVNGRIRNVNKDADRVILGVMFDDAVSEAMDKLVSFISLISDIEK